MGDEYISLARVLKTQGRRGEVAVEVHSDVPDRFVEGMRLFALDELGGRRQVKIEELWPHKGRLVLKFEGIDSISDAETLLRCELQVPQAERAELEAGWTYISDLTGCTVLDGEREIGKIEGVAFGAGEAPLLIVRGQAKWRCALSANRRRFKWPTISFAENWACRFSPITMSHLNQ